MTWTGEIDGVGLAQVRMGRNGKMVTIEDDVLNVAKQLKQIDPRFHVRWSELGQYFVVYCREPHDPEGFGSVVLYAQSLDQRVVDAIREVVYKNNKPGYSFADELDCKEDAANAARDKEFSRQIAENAEELAWAIRKDLNENQGRVFFDKGIPNGNS